MQTLRAASDLEAFLTRYSRIYIKSGDKTSKSGHTLYLGRTLENAAALSLWLGLVQKVIAEERRRDRRLGGRGLLLVLGEQSGQIIDNTFSSVIQVRLI